MATRCFCHKKFGDLSVLNGINEHISPGEVVVVIGPSGSGKSTFLRCLNLLEEVTEGEINSLHSAGKIFLTACGMTIRVIV